MARAISKPEANPPASVKKSLVAGVKKMETIVEEEEPEPEDEEMIVLGQSAYLQPQ